MLGQPPAGRGNILRALRACLPVHEAVVGSDMHEAAMAPDLRQVCSVAFGQDFLAADGDAGRLPPTSCINPPFKACRCARPATPSSSCPSAGKLAALLRFNWIAARRRADLLQPASDRASSSAALKMLPPGVPDLGL